MTNTLHERAEPYHEVVEGLVQWQDDQLTLVVPSGQAPPQPPPQYQGTVILRYGIELLQAPHVIIPGYFETENGASKTGLVAWQFMWKKFQLYPRADVVGWREDGKPLHVWMRDLDFSQGIQVVAYPHLSLSDALGIITALQTEPDANLPPLLAAYQDDWRQVP